MTKFKNSKCDKTLKLKRWQNFESKGDNSQNLTKLSMSVCFCWRQSFGIHLDISRIMVATLPFPHNNTYCIVFFLHVLSWNTALLQILGIKSICTWTQHRSLFIVYCTMNWHVLTELQCTPIQHTVLLGNSCRIGTVRHPRIYFFWIFS